MNVSIKLEQIHLNGAITAAAAQTHNRHLEEALRPLHTAIAAHSKRNHFNTLVC